MSDGVQTLVFPDAGGTGGGGMMSMLAPLLQQRGLDPNILAVMNSKNGNGFGGEGGMFIWVIFLFFLMGWGGNGWGNNGGGNNAGGIPNLINNDAGRELLMSAIQGNGTAISQLASNLNCSVGQVQQSINAVMSQVQGVGNQVGMTGQQIINAIQQGNMNIAQQLCNCCCEINGNITKMGYENQLSICNQTNTLVNNANQNTLSLRDGANANTQAILGKLDAMQTQALYDKIDKLREENGTYKTSAMTSQIVSQATAPLGAVLGDLSARLAKIECGLPPTVAVPWPQIAAYDKGVYQAAAAGAYRADVAAAAYGNGCGC